MALLAGADAEGPQNLPSVAFAKGSKGKEALAWPRWEERSKTRLARGDFLGLVPPHHTPLCSSSSVSQGECRLFLLRVLCLRLLSGVWDRGW